MELLRFPTIAYQDKRTLFGDTAPEAPRAVHPLSQINLYTLTLTRDDLDVALHLQVIDPGDDADFQTIGVALVNKLGTRHIA